jgi:DNA gyrase/topoisomerase IV subunit B
MLTFDNKINSNRYQIGLAYRTDWYPSANVISFANDVHTVCGGSLVDGILGGLRNACKIYAKENNLTTFKINKKKFVNGLILVCSVRGENYMFGGSWKETLEDAVVKKEATKLVEKLALDFFKNEKEKAGKFLWRLDTTQLTSGMY